MVRRVVVVGGGISGLTAAYRLSSASEPLDVTLVEASPRLGGKIRTTSFGGVPIDEGADAFLARVPWAVDLCRELGLDDRLISPSGEGAFLLSRGKLRPIPKKSVLGVPTSLPALVASGAISPLGMARAGLDLIKPDNWPGKDESVSELITRRLGPEIAQRLVDPLIGSIMASDASNMSAQIVAPQLSDATRKNRSLIRALRAQRKLAAAGPKVPIFNGFEGGVGVLIDRLARAIPDVDVQISNKVTELSSVDGFYTLGTERGGLDADSVIIATPASAAAALVSPHAPEAGDILARVEYASVVLVTVSFDAASVAHPMNGTGFLVPRAEKMLMTACSWGHRKWPHWAPDDDRVVLRVSAGRHGDERAMHLDDDELVESLLAELAPILRIDGTVLEWRVSRWPDSFPQYPPGHGAEVTRAEADLSRNLPGITIAGASYRGVGVPACIRSGNEAAARILDHVSTQPA